MYCTEAIRSFGAKRGTFKPAWLRILLLFRIIMMMEKGMELLNLDYLDSVLIIVVGKQLIVNC